MLTYSYVWEIRLFLFKSPLFRTCFLYMIRYNNISQPVHDLPRPSAVPATTMTPCPKSGVRGPLKLPGLTPLVYTSSFPNYLNNIDRIYKRLEDVLMHYSTNHAVHCLTYLSLFIGPQYVNIHRT